MAPANLVTSALCDAGTAVALLSKIPPTRGFFAGLGVYDRMRIWLATAASLSAILSTAALADIDPLSGAPLPPRKEEIPSPITDHFYALAGVYSFSAKTHLRLDPNNQPGVMGTPLDAEEQLGLPDHLTQGTVELMFRLGERSKVRLDYFEADRTGTAILANDVVFGNQVFSAGDKLQSTLNWRMSGLIYTYSFYRSERFEIGTGIGLYFVQALAQGIDLTLGQSNTQSAADPFPTLPLDYTWRISRRWAFTGHVDYLKVALSQFRGWLANWHNDVQYRWNPNFAVGLGYTSIRTSYNRSTGSFTGEAYLSFNGPQAFIRFSF